MKPSPAHRISHHRSQDVSVLSDGLALRAHLRTPAGAGALVIVLEDGAPEELLARALAAAGLAALRIDPAQHAGDFADDDGIAATDRRCARLCDILTWVGTRAELADRPVVIAAVGANGTAAVIEAARRPDLVRAVALLDSAPAGAGPWLNRLRAPVLAASRLAAPEAIIPWLAAQLAARTETALPDEDAARAESAVCKRSARPGNRDARRATRSDLDDRFDTRFDPRFDPQE